MTKVKRVGSGNRNLQLMAALCFSAGGLYGWSAMIPALQAAFGVSTELAGLVFSISIVVFSAAVYAAPRLPDGIRGVRAGAVIGLVGSAALSIAAVAGDFIIFLLVFGLGFGAASGAIYILAIEAAGKSQRPGFATPVMIASFGLGGATYGPGLRYLVGYGWGLGALFLLAGVLALTSVAALTLSASSRQKMAIIDRHDAPTSTAAPILATSTVVLLWCTFATGSIAGLMTLGLATSIVESYGGGLWLSGIALFGIAVGNTGGRLSVGLLSERLSPGMIVTAAPLISAIGIVVAGTASTAAAVAVGLVVVATGYGLIAAGIPTLTRAFSGSVNFGRIFSIVFMAWGVAGLLSPWMAGRLFDLYGDFGAAFVLAFAASLASSGLAWILRRRLMRAPANFGTKSQHAE